MNKIEKLFRKISKKERSLLLEIIASIKSKDKNLAIKKLAGSDLYRIRKRMFRIIFHYDTNGSIVIDSVKVRKENTYKNL